MGNNKAFLRLGTETLLERTLATARRLTPNVRIGGARELYAAYGEVIEDVYSDCGPLGGIHAALSATKTHWNIVLSVDMPFLQSDFLAWLSKVAQSSPAIAVVPRALGTIQPLCAVYARPLRALAEKSLEEGDYKIGRLLQRVPTRYIEEPDIRAAGFNLTILRNVNTKEEFAAAAEDAGISLTTERTHTA